MNPLIMIMNGLANLTPIIIKKPEEDDSDIPSVKTVVPDNNDHLVLLDKDTVNLMPLRTKIEPTTGVIEENNPFRTLFDRVGEKVEKTYDNIIEKITSEPVLIQEKSEELCNCFVLESNTEEENVIPEWEYTPGTAYENVNKTKEVLILHEEEKEIKDVLIESDDESTESDLIFVPKPEIPTSHESEEEKSESDLVPPPPNVYPSSQISEEEDLPPPPKEPLPVFETQKADQIEMMKEIKEPPPTAIVFINEEIKTQPLKPDMKFPVIQETQGFTQEDPAPLVKSDAQKEEMNKIEEVEFKEEKKITALQRIQLNEINRAFNSNDSESEDIPDLEIIEKPDLSFEDLKKKNNLKDLENQFKINEDNKNNEHKVEENVEEKQQPKPKVEDIVDEGKTFHETFNISEDEKEIVEEEEKITTVENPFDCKHKFRSCVMNLMNYQHNRQRKYYWWTPRIVEKPTNKSIILRPTQIKNGKLTLKPKPILKPDKISVLKQPKTNFKVAKTKFAFTKPNPKLNKKPVNPVKPQQIPIRNNKKKIVNNQRIYKIQPKTKKFNKNTQGNYVKVKKDITQQIKQKINPDKQVMHGKFFAEDYTNTEIRPNVSSSKHEDYVKRSYLFHKNPYLHNYLLRYRQTRIQNRDVSPKINQKVLDRLIDNNLTANTPDIILHLPTIDDCCIDLTALLTTNFRSFKLNNFMSKAEISYWFGIRMMPLVINQLINYDYYKLNGDTVCYTAMEVIYKFLRSSNIPLPHMHLLELMNDNDIKQVKYLMSLSNQVTYKIFKVPIQFKLNTESWLRFFMDGSGEYYHFPYPNVLSRTPFEETSQL